METYTNLPLPPRDSSNCFICKLPMTCEDREKDGIGLKELVEGKDPNNKRETYTPLTKLLARWARLGRTHDGSGNHAKKYSSISATNQHQISSKIYQSNLQSFFV